MTPLAFMALAGCATMTTRHGDNFGEWYAIIQRDALLPVETFFA